VPVCIFGACRQRGLCVLSHTLEAERTRTLTMARCARDRYTTFLRPFKESGVLPLLGKTGSREILLRDGAAVTLRPVRRSDVAALRDFLQHLSPESRYFRFQGTLTDLSEAEWQYLVSADGWNHVAILAWSGSVVVGVGRFIRLEPESDRAEVAFAIADAFQRRGLGSLLRDELVAAGTQSGIRLFRAEVLAQNRGIRGLLCHSLRVVSDVDGAIEVALGLEDARPASLPS
jgi:RimJ/RimL family protein N-acetyltransferase